MLNPSPQVYLRWCWQTVGLPWQEWRQIHHMGGVQGGSLRNHWKWGNVPLNTMYLCSSVVVGDIALLPASDTPNLQAVNARGWECGCCRHTTGKQWAWEQTMLPNLRFYLAVLNWVTILALLSDPEEIYDQHRQLKYKDVLIRDERRFKGADADGNGKLNRDEFATFLHPGTCWRVV